MPSLNQRNSQLLGALGLLGGALRDNKFGDDKPKGEHAAGKERDQTKFFEKQNDVRVSIRQYGIEKPNLTYVRLGIPKMMEDAAIPDVKAIAKEVTLRAERVNQPGIQLVTSNVRRYGVGPTEKKPFTAQTGDINISFIGDARGVIHQFFYIWMNGIVNAYNIPDLVGVKDIFGKYPYEVEYFYNYRIPIEILLYDEERQEISTIVLHNAFPIAMGEIQRDWASINDLVRINVTFAYSHWSYGNKKLLGLSAPTRETLASQKSSLIDIALKGMTAIQAISSIKRPQNVNDILNVVNTGSTLLSSFLPRGIDY